MSKKTQSPIGQHATAQQLEAIEQEKGQDKLNNNQNNQQNENSAPGSGDQLPPDCEEKEIERNNTQNAQHGSSNAAGKA